MMRISMAGMVIVSMTLGGCAAKQQPAPLPPPRIVHEVAPAPAAPPPLTAAQILAAQPAEVREAVKEHDQKGEWPSYKTTAYVLYPYNEGPEPIVDSAPLRTTDLQLQPGETITDLALGDQERWMATPASSGDPRNPIPHVALKPQVPGIDTNLTIYTTRHIYHLILRSGARSMQEVEFYYPEELLTAMNDADVAVAKFKQATVQHSATDPTAAVGASTDNVAAVDPGHLNFSYEVSGPNVPWKPVRAYDDGSHVFIQMGSGMSTNDAPALLIASGGGTQMVNYRVVDGDCYVVDRLFDKAILLSGVGREQDRVTIAYSGEAR
jgi:type IV secretion system protein TrbG